MSASIRRPVAVKCLSEAEHIEGELTHLQPAHHIGLALLPLPGGIQYLRHLCVANNHYAIIIR